METNRFGEDFTNVPTGDSPGQGFFEHMLNNRMFWAAVMLGGLGILASLFG